MADQSATAVPRAAAEEVLADLPPTNRTRQPNLPAAAAACREMLEHLGIPIAHPGMARTPARFVAAMVELTAGLDADPAEHLATTFPPETLRTGLIAVPGIRFVAVCEHHLLAFTGTVTVGYVPAPGARIVGLSKLARLVRGMAARPQVQERLGVTIVEAITARLVTLGAGCVIRSAHTCMTLRGVRAEGAEMVTVHTAGVLETDAAIRAEFLAVAS